MEVIQENLPRRLIPLRGVNLSKSARFPDLFYCDLFSWAYLKYEVFEHTDIVRIGGPHTRRNRPNPVRLVGNGDAKIANFFERLFSEAGLSSERSIF